MTGERRMMKAYILMLLSLLLAPCFGEGRAIGRLTLDGVSVGQSYAEVLKVLGRPNELDVNQGLVAFVYPAPKGRSEGTHVWFDKGTVVYCTGYALEEDDEPLFLYGMQGSVLQERFGESEELNEFARWWPASGVVLAGRNIADPGQTLHSPLGLRSLAFPVEKVTDPPGSRFEPWADDELETWLADDVELGMNQQHAAKMAGSLDVMYDAGYVRGVRGPQSLLLNHLIGMQNFSVQFDVGEKPAPFGKASPLKAPRNGWITPSRFGRVKLKGGKIAELQLWIDDEELFQALRSLQLDSADGL